MTGCKYWDAGWCYAPKDIKANDVKGACIEPEYCPYLKTQMTEKERIEGEIKILQKKLALLEEIEKTKTPCEEAYKRVYGKYPVKEVSENLTSEDNWNVVSWSAFQKGYEQAQKDYKVGEFQEPEEEPQELKTLYQMLNDEEFRDDVCYVVKEWMSQYTHNVMSGEYASGYEDCMLVLEEHLK